MTDRSYPYCRRCGCNYVTLREARNCEHSHPADNSAPAAVTGAGVPIPDEAVSYGLDAWRDACLMNTGREQGIRMVLEAAAPTVVAADYERQAAQALADAANCGGAEASSMCQECTAVYDHLTRRAAELREAAK